MVTKKGLSQARLGDVPPDKVFWCHDGRVIKNLAELVAALREMSEETFCYHVTQDKNDFSNWVRDVIGDNKLAWWLQNRKTQAGALSRVEARLSWLQARL